MKLKNGGLEERTVKIIGFYLNHIAINVSLENPEKVKEFIANKQVDNGFKGNLVKAYNYYARVNGIVWDRPRYRWEQNKPRILASTMSGLTELHVDREKASFSAHDFVQFVSIQDFFPKP